jgi:hypothetical protein
MWVAGALAFVWMVWAAAYYQREEAVFTMVPALPTTAFVVGVVGGTAREWWRARRGS